MAIIARNSKNAGGTAFVDNTDIEASEVNDDFDTIYSAFNGGIDEDNFSGSIAIPNADLVDIEPEKVMDYAATNAEYTAVTLVGDTATPSLPTDLAEELARIRYTFRAGKRQSGIFQYMDSAGALQTCGWFEPPITGQNLLPNAGFEVHTGAVTDAPDGWTLVSTPSNVAIEAAADETTGEHKRSLNIVTDGSDEGIQYTIQGLKDGTKYLVGASYTRTAGEMNIITAGGLAATNAYQDIAFSDSSSSTLKLFMGIVKTTTSPVTDLTVQFTGTATGAEFNLHEVWCYEMNADAPFRHEHIPMQTATDSTEVIHPLSPSTPGAGVIDWDELTALSLSQYIPGPGYRLIYEVTVSWIWEEIASAPDTSFENILHGLRISLNTGGADATVEGPHYIYMEGASATAAEANGHLVTLKHIVENPTPGLIYTFSTDIGVHSASAGVWGYAIVNPLRQTFQSASSSKLYTERI